MTSVVVPTASAVQAGATTPTIFGAGPPASIHAALADLSGSTPIDTTGVHAGTTPSYNDRTFTVTFAPVLPPVNWRINYVFVRMRCIFLASTHGYFYPSAIIGQKISDDTWHRLNLPSGPPGPGSTSVHQVDTAISTHATDGTLWDECDHWQVEFKVAYDSTLVGTPWDASNYPRLVYAALVLDTSDYPLPYDVLPTTTQTVSQPTISWTNLTSGGQQQTAFRVFVIPAGAHDADGVGVGVDPFDPTTSDAVSWDSGKVYGSQQSVQCGEPLANGEYWAYVKGYDGTGATEIESVWDFDSAANFDVDGDTIALPTVTLSDDTATYTTQVQIVAGGAGGVDHVAASIQVQRYDSVAGVWRSAPIPDGLVAGTGTSLFFDGLNAPDSTVSYRARGVYITGAGALFVSAWDTDTYVAGNFEQHWLRSTTDHTLNRTLQDVGGLLVKTWKTGRDRPQSSAYGLGARAATVSYDVMKGNVHQLSVWTMGEAAYDSLRALLDGGDDLVLVSQWGEVWRCQVGPRVDEDWQRAAPTGSETTPLGLVRVVDFDLIEVVTP